MRIPVFFITLGCQKAAHILVIGNLHKPGTAFVTLGENRLGFVQVANQKTGNRLLTPESYYEIIPKTVFVYISYIVQMQMGPDNSECSPLPLKTAIPNRPPLAVQP